MFVSLFAFPTNAQYVDLEYEGGGISEYQFWNTENQAWDTSTCGRYDGDGGGCCNNNNGNNNNNNNGNNGHCDEGGDDNDANNGGGTGRCAKMDCHLEDTHFTLVGFFKEPGYYDWMEQLFKHEGVCVWSDEQYNVGKSGLDIWPDGCSGTDATDENGNALYYDVKPLQGGAWTVGLYTDNICSKDYTGSMKVEDVIGNIFEGGDHHDENNNGNQNSFEDSLAAWNSALSVFTICQPCVAYDLSEAHFTCCDKAGYTNVNQVR